MSYGDGGFYFLQPVGNGYSGVEVLLNPGYGATGGSRSGGTTSKDPFKTPFTATQFSRIVTKFGDYTKALYKKAWGYAPLTKERRAGEKAWAEADRALGQLRVMKASLKRSQWVYGDLPSAVRAGIGSWIVRDVLKVATTVTPRVTPIVPSRGRDLSLPRPSTATLPGRSSLAPSGDVMTLEMPAETTAMGPQETVSETEAAVAQSQADLTTQATATVDAATGQTVSTGGGAGGTGIGGFLATDTGKLVAAAAVLGGGYLLWKNRRSLGFGS